jgi:VIT1/CCC1 family predicted Fe2+/Mn2+ transporter
MPDGAHDARRYRDNLQAETDSAAVYRALATLEPRPEIAEVYRRLAAVEEAHARLWKGKLEAAGESVGQPRPSWRARTLAFIGRTFGPQAVLPIVIGQERFDSAQYERQPEGLASGLPAAEQSHRRLLSLIATVPRGLAGPALARFEGRHRAVGGNALRAAVLGANDGLVSNFSLLMGVAGAAVGGQGILVTGLAGLLAGAGSMALGEWLSVQSSRELNLRQLAIEEEELAAAPEEEAEELRLIYRAKGLPDDQAKALASRIIADPRTARDTLAREELGIDPEDLGGSAWEAAGTSFILFAAGAMIPVVPFFFLRGPGALLASAAASALALFAIGAAITVFTGRNALFSGARQLVFGLGAAALTFGVGKLIGVAAATP